MPLTRLLPKKGRHSMQALIEHADYETCIPDPRQHNRRWRNMRGRTLKECRALLNNRKRPKGGRGESYGDFAARRWTAALRELWKLAAAGELDCEALRRIKSGTSS